MKLKGIGWEDVAIGEWMQENNIQINSSLKLNGWFPLQKYWDRLNKEGDNYAKQLITKLTEEENKMLVSYLTHHYIRWFSLMEYINNIQKTQE